jgi:tetratricopeptide (TPR) repeat protein
MAFEYKLAKIRFEEGIKFYKKRNFIEAEKSFEEANRIFPNRESVIISLINTKINLDKLLEAKNLIEIYSNNNPTSKKILFSKAILFAKTGEFHDSIKLLDSFIDDDFFSNEEKSDFYILKGTCFSKIGSPDKAEECYDTASQLDAFNHNAFWHLSLSKLSISQCRKGWDLYEYRFKRKNITNPCNVNDLKDFKNKVILVQYEQGYGDIIQFARYLPVLKKFCKKVLFLIPKELNKLFSQINIEITNSENGMVYDEKIFLMSLPKLMFRAGINYSKEDYLNLQFKDADKPFTNGKLNVGLAWSGRDDYPYDFLRSIPLLNFKKILELQNNINFYCLQRDIRQSDKDLYQKYKINYAGDKNFFELANLINSLDLVISSDTSILHLSGTLMKETFALLPFAADWRWGESTLRTPWYSSVKIFKCENYENNWTYPINNIVQLLNNKFND